MAKDFLSDVNFQGTVTLTDTDAGSSAAPIIELYRNSSSPADADYIGQLKFQGENDNDQKVVYAKITAKIGDATDTTEDGIIEVTHVKAGSNNISARWTSDALKLINGTGLEIADGLLTLGSTAVTATAAELNLVDGITAGTISASKAVIVDSNKDITGFRNVTLTGELDAATLDISGDADIDGTLEADAITVNGTALDEFIADTIGAMVTSNTETGVAVTYEDSDNTLDFVIGTLNQDTTGNSATATALATARNIGGVSFDGTGNIDLPGVNSAGNQNTSGNAATATALETARTINGTSFDGSANITVTAAAGTVTGATLNSGVTASSLTSVGTLTGLTVGGTAAINSDQDITDFTDDSTGNLTLYNSDGAVDDFTCLDFDGNSTDPAARIGMKYTSGGSELHFGVSNSYASGITRDALIIGPTGLVSINSNSAITPDSAWDGHLTIDGNGYAGGLSLDDTGMWIGHNSASRTIIFATNETSIASFSSSGSTDLSLHGGTSTGYTQASIKMSVPDDNRGAGTYSYNAYNDTTWFWGNPYVYEDTWRVCRKSGDTSLHNAAASVTYKLMSVFTDGDVTIGGTLTENSDSRLKREIVDSSLGLDFVNALKPREYRRIDGTRKHYGFIAQEVAAVLPDASDCAIWVNEQENVAGIDEEENIVSTQGLRYTHLIAPLVKAVQELTTRIETLEG